MNQESFSVFSLLPGNYIQLPGLSEYLAFIVLRSSNLFDGLQGYCGRHETTIKKETPLRTATMGVAAVIPPKVVLILSFDREMCGDVMPLERVQRAVDNEWWDLQRIKYTEYYKKLLDGA